MKGDYNVKDWYWIVGGSTTQVFSTFAKAYVPVSNARFVAWVTDRHRPTKIPTEAELFAVLAEQAPECLPDNAAGIRARQDNLIGKLTTEKVGIVLATVLFNHEKRLLVLEKKPTVTKAQFIAALKALL